MGLMSMSPHISRTIVYAITTLDLGLEKNTMFIHSFILSTKTCKKNPMVELSFVEKKQGKSELEGKKKPLV